MLNFFNKNDYKLDTHQVMSAETAETDKPAEADEAMSAEPASAGTAETDEPAEADEAMSTEPASAGSVEADETPEEEPASAETAEADEAAAVEPASAEPAEPEAPAGAEAPAAPVSDDTAPYTTRLGGGRVNITNYTDAGEESGGTTNIIPDLSRFQKKTDRAPIRVKAEEEPDQVSGDTVPVSLGKDSRGLKERPVRKSPDLLSQKIYLPNGPSIPAPIPVPTGPHAAGWTKMSRSASWRIWRRPAVPRISRPVR